METKEYRLGDVVEVVDTLHATAPVVDNDTPYKMIRTANVRDGHLLTDTMRCVTEETYDKWTRRGTLEVGDVILTREAPMGEVGIIKRNDVRYFLGQRTLRLRPISNVLNNEFLYYYLQGPYMQQQIGFNEGTGATVSNIRIPILLNMRMELPSLGYQSEIVNILGAIDSKIELNQQINKNLLRLSKFYFKSFTHCLEMREGSLSEYVKSIDKGISYKSENLVKNFVDKSDAKMFLSLANFDLGGFFKYGKMKWYDGPYKEKHLVNPGDIIAGATDVTQERKILGLPVIVPPIANEMLYSLDVFRINVNDEYKYWILEAMQTRRFKKQIEGAATGTTVLRVNKNVLLDMSIPMPSEKLLAKYNEAVKPLIDQWNNHLIENRKLHQLRTLLLPRLIAGDIELSNIETVMNNA